MKKEKIRELITIYIKKEYELEKEPIKNKVDIAKNRLKYISLIKKYYTTKQ